MIWTISSWSLLLIAPQCYQKEILSFPPIQVIGLFQSPDIDGIPSILGETLGIQWVQARKPLPCLGHPDVKVDRPWCWKPGNTHLHQFSRSPTPMKDCIYIMGSQLGGGISTFSKKTGMLIVSAAFTSLFLLLYLVGDRDTRKTESPKVSLPTSEPRYNALCCRNQLPKPIACSLACLSPWTNIIRVFLYQDDPPTSGVSTTA